MNRGKDRPLTKKNKQSRVLSRDWAQQLDESEELDGRIDNQVELGRTYCLPYQPS